jgi:translation initiation factor IF-3
LIDAEGNQKGIVALYEALRMAEEVQLDLVEISPNAAPPVCKIMNFGKHLFELNKQRNAAKKKQKQVQTKEIKLRPGTDVGDYQVKLKKITEFLEEGDKVKITLRFRGREMSHQELGMEMMNRLKADLETHAVIEQQPKFEGRQMVMVMGPQKKKK